MKYPVLLILSLSTIFVHAQQSVPYQPDWASLDQRVVPAWFSEAKFGIFIHWGVYSVPGFSSKGDYAEWYQEGLERGDAARVAYHKQKFGEKTYYDFAPDFKAELFKPEEWAMLFEKSGARYIVITSKHHDGFCLWPNQTANTTWGFPWNAVDTGPRRDLLGDLFKAVRKTPVKAGMYYSLYEWYNPLWKTDKDRYVNEHMWPQMKELITTYQPDVFWTDGDWELPAEKWKSEQFLAWLYNESPVRNTVVTNDRWGSGIRFNHGGVYTPEYQPDLDFESHPWEESRGMGASYGYNRQEDSWDYNSTQSLVIALVDKVSRGGNFLLDIGPDEHGKIPPIMQERLLQIGQWMDYNSEAIYQTSRWKTDAQWSEGKRNNRVSSQNAGVDIMLKLTLDPDPGYAVKEIFFTYNAKTNSLYAIFPKYPATRTLSLKNVELPPGTVISFLTTKEKLVWKQLGADALILLPEYHPDKMKTPYAYVVKIEGYGKFASRAQMTVAYEPSNLKATATLSAKAGETIRYTLDGTEPTIASPAYTTPIRIDKTQTVSAKTFADGALAGATSQSLVKRFEWVHAVKAAAPKPGIAYTYREPADRVSMASFTGPVAKQGIAEVISTLVKQRSDKFAVSFEGYLRIDKDALYTFTLFSDDGSILWIDDAEVVNNDGDHGSLEVSGRTALRKGYHKIKVHYFDSGGNNALGVFVNEEGRPRSLIPASILFH